MNNDQLVALIAETAAAINDTTTDLDKHTAELREHIKPNCHVGRGADMNDSDAGYRLQLEWYAGQLLEMLDKKHYQCINSWLNCVDKFTRRYA